MRISDWSSDVCSSDLYVRGLIGRRHREPAGVAAVRSARTVGVVRWNDVESRIRRQLGDEFRHRDDMARAAVGENESYALRRKLRRERQIGTARPQHRENAGRSEEHTYELQSLMRISYAVFCLKRKRKRRSHRNRK